VLKNGGRKKNVRGPKQKRHRNHPRMKSPSLGGEGGGLREQPCETEDLGKIFLQIRDFRWKEEEENAEKKAPTGGQLFGDITSGGHRDKH